MSTNKIKLLEQSDLATSLPVASLDDTEGDPENVSLIAPADGVSTFLARRDHVHYLDPADSLLEAAVQTIIDNYGPQALITLNGWEPRFETWTYASADDPVYQVYVSGNITANPGYKLGTKVKCTNNSTTFYGFIVKVGAYDGGNNRTPVDLYGGTDYDIANSAITDPHISKIKSPDGFPLTPEKWTVTLSDASQRSQASPTSNTWYNLGSLSLNIPIGVWRVFYELAIEFTVTLAAAANRGFRSTLSTANNSESDGAFTASFTFSFPAITGGAGRATVHREKTLALTSKTTYYLLGSAGGVATATSLDFRGDVIATTVKCVCVYL
jgi:hypothetical protein